MLCFYQIFQTYDFKLNKSEARLYFQFVLAEK